MVSMKNPKKGFGVTILLAVFLILASISLVVFKWQAASVARWDTSYGTVDAIFVFAGQTSRIHHALDLADGGVSKIVVVSAPPGNVSDNRVCSRETRGEVTVVCLEPDPENTRGEGQMFARFAQRSGFKEALLVTNESHVERAYQHFSNCWSGVLLAETVPGGSSHGPLREKAKAGFLKVTGAC